MKVGVFGAGRIGSLHAKVIAGHPDVERVLVADVDGERAAAVAAGVGGGHGSVGEVMGSGLDAAVITAATHVHAELIRACLDAGVPAFCEKPVATTFKETVRIVERVESSGAILQMGFQRRFDAGYREAKRLIEAGEIGTVYSLRLMTHDPEPPHENYIPESGGIFRDMHVHDLDVLRWLTGSEVEVAYALGSVRRYEVFGRYDDFDASALTVRMENGVLAVITGTRQAPYGYDVRTEIHGSHDNVSVGLDPRTPIRSVEPGTEPYQRNGYRNFAARFEDAYRAELSRFLDVARGRAENPCTARDALEASRAAEAAQRSVEQQRPVKVAEVW